ncbi:MAG: tRNA (adenosine(37)-N6)-dimethylallyltransferase MiaA [Hyphomicrobiales bacterium]|nr:tRNA (adenosine(37)-N6)-dimethylallyltransferase MiaA [Hyphomicrobiales bacterium]
MSSALFTLIAGPTASGKSKLAIKVARERGAIIVNADSMQVYEDLKILTARPDDADCEAVPHRLYGFRDGGTPYSVAAWLEDLAPLVAESRKGGSPLIIVGGTGLYFKALLEGLSPVPDIPDAIRSHWRAEAVARGSRDLHGILRDRDPEMARRLQPSDPQRIVRALEVLDATGRSLADWQSVAGKPLVRPEEAECFCLSPPREELYRRCDARWDSMMMNGALEEVKRLVERGLNPSLPVMRAVGVRPLAAYLGGAVDFETACCDARTETRRYAKRQLTWARKNMISWKPDILE